MVDIKSISERASSSLKMYKDLQGFQGRAKFDKSFAPVSL
jgi:hypothetical protein